MSGPVADVQGVLGGMKTCVVVPVHNEALFIGRVVGELKEKGFEVVVVDDGSHDGSGGVAKEKGAVVLSHEKRKGKGSSLRDGFRYAVEHGFDGVVAMDGDGQHAIEDVDAFIKKARESPDCVIVGSRMKNPKGMPFVRFLTNKIMSFLISLLCRQTIDDTQCGFRFIGTKVLKEINLSSSDYEIESEVLIKATKKGFRIFSVPIQTIYSHECSKINPLTDTVRFFRYILREAWNSKP